MILDFLCVYIHVFVPSCCVLLVFYITFFPSLQPFYVKSLSLMFSFFISCLTFVCLGSLNPPVYEFQLCFPGVSSLPQTPFFVLPVFFLFFVWSSVVYPCFCYFICTCSRPSLACIPSVNCL